MACREPVGYVLNAFHERGDEDMVLHRANCTHVADHSVTHQGKTYTGGPRIKVCALDVESLKEYVVRIKPLMATIEVSALACQ